MTKIIEQIEIKENIPAVPPGMWIKCEMWKN